MRLEKETRKDTKNQIINAFKQLLSTKPIEHITIKEITDSAGIIRPTFYNHFSDKYNVIETIIWEELLLPIKPLFVNDMIREGLTLLFSNIKKDDKFYTNAVKIEGQNSFEFMARDAVRNLLLEVIKEKEVPIYTRYSWLTQNTVAEYTAYSMIYIAISWIKRDYVVTPTELSEIYVYLANHSVFDMFNEPLDINLDIESLVKKL